MTIGDPLDRGTAHGPQNHRAHLEKLIEYVETGVREGARLVYGGKQVDMPGLYFMPTVLADVEDSMWVAKEESFGPIMVVSKFAKGDTKEVSFIVCDIHKRSGRSFLHHPTGTIRTIRKNRF